MTPIESSSRETEHGAHGGTEARNKSLRGRLDDCSHLCPPEHRPHRRGGRIEVSEGKRSRAVADVTGVGAGIGGGFGLGTALDGTETVSSLSSESPSASLPAFAVGMGVAHLIGRERWRTVPVPSLARFVALVKPWDLFPRHSREFSQQHGVCPLPFSGRNWNGVGTTGS